jgi:putative heme-binding domain-containing protein
MRRSAALVFGVLLVAAAMTISAQDRATTASAADADALRRGSLMFRARCAGCHGLDGKGISGPDLTQALAAGLSDDRFFRIVRNGQGTEMPRFTSEQTSDQQVREILVHLRTLTAGGAAAPARGNAANGSKLFEARCAACHAVGGRGGRLGPDLSRIGALRSSAALTGKVRNPNRSFVAGYRPVTIVLGDGRRIRGVAKNEDAFSIQVMDATERLHGFRKSDVREVVHEPRSLMPVFDAAALSDPDLTDLVAYLSTLRKQGI